MKINVTQRDIDSGLRNDCTLCPVARAIKRRLGKSKSVQVFETSIDIYNSKDRLEKQYNIPELAQLFIKNFDTGCPVGPFSFTLNLKENRT